MGKPSLLKQIAGAVIGGALGLAAYSAYGVVAPHLTAWTTIPQRWMTTTSDVPVQLAEKGRSAKEQKHFAARAAEISEVFGASYRKYHLEDASSSADSVMSEASSASSVVTEAAVSSEMSSIADPSWIDMGQGDAHASPMAGDSMYGSVAADSSKSPKLPSSGFGSVLGIVGALSGAIGWCLPKKKIAA